MERTIRFRGKRITDGEWIYGDFFRNRGLAFIAEDGVVENPLASWKDYNVTPDTVGQFTGLCDASGKEIYEGDIIESSFGGGIPARHFVGYDEKEAAFTANLIGAYPNSGGIRQSWIDQYEKKVIGNIYDNPELLKENEE